MAQPPSKKPTQKPKSPFERLLKPQTDQEMEILGPGPKPGPSIYEQILGLEPGTSFIPRQAAAQRREREEGILDQTRQQARKARQFTFEPPTESDTYRAAGLLPPEDLTIRQIVRQKMGEFVIGGEAPLTDFQQRLRTSRLGPQELPLDVFDNDVFRPLTGDQTKLAKNPWTHLSPEELVQLEDPNFKADLLRIASKPSLTRSPEENELISKFVLPGLDPSVHQLPLDLYESAKDRQRALSRVSRGASFARGLYGESYGGPEITEPTGYLDPDYLSWKFGEVIRTGLGVADIDPGSVLSAPFLAEREEEKGFVGEAYNRVFGSLSSFIDDSVTGIMALSPEARRDPFVFELLRQDHAVNEMRYMSDPDRQGFGWDVLSGAASTIPFIVGAATLGIGGVGGMAPFLLGAAQNAGSAYEDARNSGATHEEALRAGHVGLAIGLLEGAGLEGNLQKFGLRQTITEALRGIVREAGQEGVTQWLNNLNAKLLSGYDPDRALMEGVADATAIGGLLGGVFEAPGVARGAKQAIETAAFQRQIEEEGKRRRAQEHYERLVALSKASQDDIAAAIARGEIRQLPDSTEPPVLYPEFAAARTGKKASAGPAVDLIQAIDTAIQNLSGPVATAENDPYQNYATAVQAISDFSTSPELREIVGSIREGKLPKALSPELKTRIEKVYDFYTTFRVGESIANLVKSSADPAWQSVVRESFAKRNGSLQIGYQPALANPGALVFTDYASMQSFPVLSYLAPVMNAVVGTGALEPLSKNLEIGAAAGFATESTTILPYLAQLRGMGLITQETFNTFIEAHNQANKYGSSRLNVVAAVTDDTTPAKVASHEMVHVGQVDPSLENLRDRLTPHFFELRPGVTEYKAPGDLAYEFRLFDFFRGLSDRAKRRSSKSPAVIPSNQYDGFYAEFATYLQGQDFEDLLRYLYHSLSGYWPSMGKELPLVFKGTNAGGPKSLTQHEKVFSGAARIDVAELFDPQNAQLASRFFDTLLPEIASHYFSDTFRKGFPSRNRSKAETLRELYSLGADTTGRQKINDLVEQFLLYYLYHLAVEQDLSQGRSQDFSTFVHVNKSNPVFRAAMDRQFMADGSLRPGLLERLAEFIGRTPSLGKVPTVLKSYPISVDQIQAPTGSHLLGWLRSFAPNLSREDDLVRGEVSRDDLWRYPSKLSTTIGALTDPKAKKTPGITKNSIIASKFNEAGITLPDGSAVTPSDIVDLLDLTRELSKIIERIEDETMKSPLGIDVRVLDSYLGKLAGLKDLAKMLAEYHSLYTTPYSGYYYEVPFIQAVSIVEEVLTRARTNPDGETVKVIEEFFQEPAVPGVVSFYNPDSWKIFGTSASTLEAYKEFKHIQLSIYGSLPAPEGKGLVTTEYPLSISKNQKDITIRVMAGQYGALTFAQKLPDVTMEYAIDFTPTESGLYVIYNPEGREGVGELPEEVITEALYRVGKEYQLSTLYYVDPETRKILFERPIAPLNPTQSGWTQVMVQPVHRKPPGSQLRHSIDSRGEISEAIKAAFDEIETAREYGETEIGKIQGDRRNVGALVKQMGTSVGRAMGRQVKDPARPELERDTQAAIQAAAEIVAEVYEQLGKSRKGRPSLTQKRAEELVDQLGSRLDGLRSLTEVESFEARWVEDHLIPILEGVRDIAYNSLGKTEMQGENVIKEEPALSTEAPTTSNSVFGDVIDAYSRIQSEGGAAAAKMQEFAEYLAGRQDLGDILIAAGVSIESSGDPLTDLEDAIGQVVTKFFEGWTPTELADTVAAAVDQDATGLVPTGRKKRAKKAARAKADKARNEELDEITQTSDPANIEEVPDDLAIPSHPAPKGTMFDLEALARKERGIREATNAPTIVSDVMWGSGPAESTGSPLRLTQQESKYLEYSKAGFTEVYPGIFQEPDGTYRLLSEDPGARKWVLAKTLEARRPAYLPTEELLSNHPASAELLVELFDSKNLDPRAVADLLAEMYRSNPKRFARTLAPIFGVPVWAVEALRDFGVVTQNYGTGKKNTLSFLDKTGPNKGKVNERRFFEWAADQVLGQITWTEEELADTKSKKGKVWQKIFKVESEDFVEKLKYHRYPDFRLIEPADPARVPYLILPQAAINTLVWVDAYMAKLESVQRPLTVDEVAELPTTSTTRGLSIPLSFLWEAQKRERKVMEGFDPGPGVAVSPFRTFLQILPEALKQDMGDYRYLSGVLNLLADSAIKRGFESLTLVSNDSEATTSIEARVRHESFHTVQDLLSRGADQSVLNDVIKDALRQAGVIAGTIASLHSAALRENPLIRKAMKSMLGTAIMARAGELAEAREDIFISEMVPYILEGRYMGLSPEEQVEVVTAYFEDIIANQPEETREQARAVLRLAVEYPAMFSERLENILSARERIENAEIENSQMAAPSPPIEETGPPSPPADERVNAEAGRSGSGIEGGGPPSGPVASQDEVGGGSGAPQPPTVPPVSPPPPPIPSGAPGPVGPIVTHIISLEALKATVEEMVAATSKGDWTWDQSLPVFQNIGAAIRAGALDLTTLASRMGIDEATLVSDLADLVEESETLAGQQLQVLSELQKAYEFLFNQLVFPTSTPAPAPTPTGAPAATGTGTPAGTTTGAGVGSSQTGGTVRPGTPPSPQGIAAAQAVLPAIVIAKQLMKILNSSTLNYTLPTRLTMLMKKNMLSVFQTASVQFITTGLRSGVEIARGAIRGAILGGISRRGDFGLQSPNWFRRTFDSVLMSVQPSVLMALNFVPNIGKFKARDAVYRSISSKLSVVDPRVLIDALRMAHPKIIAKLEGEIRDWAGSDFDVMIEALRKSAELIAAAPMTKTQMALAEKAMAKVDMFKRRRKFNESVLGKLIKADETILDKVFLRPLTWQEYTFRQPMFVGALTEILARKGLNLRQIYLNNDLERIPTKDLEEAMREATFFTMAQDPATEQDMLGKIAEKSISAINALGPLSLVISAFPRVIYNAIKFTWEYSPLGMLGLMGSPQMKVRFRPTKKVDPLTGQFVQVRQTPDDIRFIADRLAKGLTGTMLYAIAVSLSDDDLIGEEWWQIKAGRDARGNQTYVDARNLFPFTPFLFFAVWLRRFQEGNVGNQSLAKDVKEMFFGFQRQAGEVGDQFFFDLFDSFAAMAEGGENPAKETQDIMTRLGSVPLTPLINFRYLVSLFNEEERVKMDPALVGGLAPFIDKVPGKYIWGERFGVHPLHGRTVGDFVKMYESPLAWAMGLKTGQDSFVGQEAAKFGLDVFKFLPKDPIPYINHFKTQQFGSLVQLVSEELAKDPSYLRESQDNRKIIIDTVLRNIAQQVNEVARDRFAAEMNLRSQRQELGDVKAKATGFEPIYLEELKKLRQAINLNEFECGVRKRPPFPVYQPKPEPTPEPTPVPEEIPDINLEELPDENEQ